MYIKSNFVIKDIRRAIDECKIRKFKNKKDRLHSKCKILRECRR